MSQLPDPQDEPSISALAQDIRRVAGKLKRRLREQADTGDLPPSHTSVLLRLEQEGPTTTSNLARMEAMRPQSMGSVVAALVEAGMVQGFPDPADGRQTLLSLTERCRAWIGQGRTARQDWLSRSLQDRFSKFERDQLSAAIALLARLVDD